MASQLRQNKSNRKPAPDSTASRRPNAWGQGARAPTFSPSPARQQQSASPASPATFPALSQPTPPRSDNPRDRVLQTLSGLTGTTITLLTKTGQRYEGVIGSTTAEGDTTGVTLKDAKEISIPGAPLKDTLFIASTNIDSYTSGPAESSRASNGDSFRTDTDISQKKQMGGRERDLQAWAPSSDLPPAPSVPGSGLGDEDTFGPGANGNTSWDQFTANEQLFGVKASFDEDVYTTKLNRNAPDFKEREKQAQKIANEILGTTVNNPHVAEERGFVVDDSGVNEEDKYGAVVRGQNAYIPPGARKTSTGTSTVSIKQPAVPSAPVQDVSNPPAKVEPPRVSVNGPDGTPKVPSPVPSATSNKPPADPLPAFRDFVNNEKNRLTQKRQAMMKNDMDKRMAELVKFSKNFKLNKPIPEDLVPILAKDEEKQRLIKEKALVDATSNNARAIGPSTPATASRGVAVAGTKMLKIGTPSLKTQATAVLDGSGESAGAVSRAVKKTLGSAMSLVSSANANATAHNDKSSQSNAKPDGGSTTASKKVSMVIQSIPPFRGGKGKTGEDANANGASSTDGGTGPGAGGANGTGSRGATTNGGLAKSTSPAASGAGGGVPSSPISATANRLNVNASSFRPNPKVVTSPKPAGVVASTVSSPKPKESTPAQPNPFFGSRPIKKSTPVNVKDDFNPFKHNKVVDASQVSAVWPYNGKRFMLMFSTQQHPPVQQPAHMVAPVHPPIPPPSYEEDSAAQAAAATRGYVYAYPPYGYQPPPMMPGMAPPGPPGAYMPPYMQHMPYPPGMPPPSVAMYSPAMGQMPPPQAYMPPPPPGSYAQPPNGTGPRPSMPPTPIPTHAHPYYHHQSPQMPHAYPIMMPPPNMAAGAPHHGYDGTSAPPVPMGGHA